MANIETITLGGTELKIEGLGGQNTEIINKSDGAVYASAYPGIVPEGDNVIEVVSGAHDGLYGTNGTLYLLGTGKVELRGTDYSVNFKKPSSSAGTTGGGGVSQSYVDNADAATLTSAKTYADTASADALTSAKAYTDAETEALDTRVTTAETAINTLNGTGEGSVQKAVADGIAEIVADAPEDFDTLKEMSDWISTHADSAAEMNTQIIKNSNDIDSLETTKADKTEIPVIPESLPANGGNADTVGNKTAEQLTQSNPNLFLNPDFRINQSGIKTLSSNGYIADKWTCNFDPGNVLFNAIRNDDNSITINAIQPLTVTAWAIIQELGITLKIGQTYTVSCKIKNATPNAFCIAGWGWATKIIDSSDGVFNMTITVNDISIQFPRFGIVSNNIGSPTGSTITIEWLKIELGSTATPFYPPDVTEETLKCGNLPSVSSSSEAYYNMLDSFISTETRRNTFRGKNLGAEFTAAQKAEVAAGTFKDLFIGDYWENNGIIWRIVDINYWLRTGDTGMLTSNHLVIMPDEGLYQAPMNDTDTTNGGYLGSLMYTQNLNDAKATIQSAFGTANILSHRESLFDGTRCIFIDSSIEIPNGAMLTGSTMQFTTFCAANSLLSNIALTSDAQFSLMKIHPKYINTSNGGSYWTQDVCNNESFCIAGGWTRGLANHAATAYDFVRPVFGIIG